MGRYIRRRLLELVVVFFAVTFLIHWFVYSLPGDPLLTLAGDRVVAESVRNELSHKFHLDRGPIVRYLYYLNDLIHGRLGYDLRGRAISDRLRARWPITLKLGLTAWLLEVVLGVGLGVVAAVRRHRLADRAVMLGTVLISSVPYYVMALGAQWLFGMRWRWLPISGHRQGWPTSYLLPAFVIALYGLAAIARLLRGSMLEIDDAEFMRSLEAKGLARGRIVGVHMLRNAAVPVVTFLAVDLGFLIGGTVVIEGVFNLPGVGQLLYGALRDHEGPTIVAISTVLIIGFLVTSAAVDILNSVIDPRIRRD